MISRAIEELDYTPNLLARGLRCGTTTIGVLILELANPFYMPMLSAVQAVSREMGYMVVVGESDRNVEEERRYLHQFHQLRVAGVIVTPASNDLAHLDAVRKKGIPIVSLATPWPEGDFVAVDNALGGRLVSRHLVSLGHRSVGYIHMAGKRSVSIDERIRGFLAGLAEAGLTVPDQWRIPTGSTRLEDGISAADNLLARCPLPTAVFATTDRLAIGLVHRLRQRGIRVPEDLAVVGCDDIPYGEMAAVPLTTLDIPKRRTGELAARLLFERIGSSAGYAGYQEPRHILLSPELVIRDSCGARARHEEKADAPGSNVVTGGSDGTDEG